MLFDMIGYDYSTPVCIRPFEKRTFYAVAMSASPYVCPSVRPSAFSGLFQHALRYQFQTRYLHSLGGMTCRVLVSSQVGHFDRIYRQKYVELIFLQSRFH